VYFTIPIQGNWKILISQTTVSTLFVMAVLITLAIIVRMKLKSFKETPETTFQNVIELLVDTIQNFIKGTLGEKYTSVALGGWYFGVIVIIWTMNMSGLLGFRNATADIITTAAFGLSTFFILHYMWLKHKKFRYFKEYFEPIVVFFPMNVVSEISVPISLSFRLFGNILGGLILMGLIYSFPFYLKIGIPAALHAYFDVFSGSIQAFIFTVLSISFIRNKLPD
jgi:F-type H+-transporting ATPase subunit a